MATFKTRARALDMLGRQQIAGIPTAIAELFKNAHDAYADSVEVDYFRWNGLFLLRDDGIGMTREEFETRWLTLGTESKLGGTTSLPPIPEDRRPRPILGEKGIGRLASAVVGRQVLILTRAKHGDRELVAAFIHWGLFESPGVDLDQIEVPIRTFPAGSLPKKADILDMVEVVQENVKGLEHLIDPERAEQLDADLASFDVDPFEYDGYLNGPSLAGEGHGTHFYIKPASEMLEADIQYRSDSGTAPPLTKLLIGFTNTMSPGHSPPLIRASFRDHQDPDSFIDLIGERSFFTPDEFEEADHQIVGSFDRYGAFSGTVTIYGEKTYDHSIGWPPGRGEPTKCGPFGITFAYVQGEPGDSKLPPEEHARLTAKLDRLGGLYLYRDGIRILPYGDTDYDWLEIEKRRTLGAGYYYFSYRRMFGVIEISREENPALSEKAGREGFRENAAYRQFRDILKHFFVQLAADFFRSRGSFFKERRGELERAAKIRREREEKAEKERKAFSKQLENAVKRIARGEPQKKVDALLRRVTRAIKTAPKTSDAARAAEVVIDAEVSARRALSDLRDTYILQKPSGYGLTRELQRDWEMYQQEVQGLEKKVIAPAFERLERIAGDSAQRAHIEIDRRRRAEAVVRAAAEEARKTISAEMRETDQVLQEVADRVRTAVQDFESTVDRATNEALKRATADGASKGANETVDDEVVEALERDLSDLARRERRELADTREQLQSILYDGVLTGLGASPLEILAAMEEELLAYRERAEADLELIQLGMAIDIINHEFNQTVDSIRRNIRRLKAWADANPDLGRLYRDLRTAFEHLDGYLTLFAPLQRRLYRKAIPITGREIADYLRDLFGERLRQENVQLEATPAFLKEQVVSFPSIFYPVFINLVDNALFWLRNTPEPRRIRLDADSDAFLISDTGPGVADRDSDVIFEPGFTRKPGGRGLGLYISRNVLSREGYRLEVLSADAGRGATFRIAQVE